MVAKEYFDICITELKNIITTSFKKLNYDLSDMRSKLEFLTKQVEALQKSNHCSMNKDKVGNTDEFTVLRFTEESSVNKNLKDKDANKTEPKEVSVNIVEKTPSKENIFKKRKMEKLEGSLKRFGVLQNSLKRMTGTCTAYNPFGTVDQSKVDSFDAWMKIDRHVVLDLGTYDGDVDKSFFVDLMTPKKWLDDRHINAGMSLLRRRLSNVQCPYRSERLAFMDIPFTVLIHDIYKNFTENPEEFAWSGMLIDYFNGTLPRCGKTGKKLGMDVDNVFVVLNIRNNHWIALDISILRKEIHVYDSSTSPIDDKDMFEFVKPYAKLFPYFIKTLTFPLDQGTKTDTQYTIKKSNKIPRNFQSGDCGIYALKYIECLALDFDMHIGLSDINVQSIRKKLAVEVFAGADHTKDF